MSNPIILELKKSNASQTVNASDYICTLPYPISIEPGTEISLKMISIDSQVADSNTIVINDPVNLAMSYSFYEYDLPAYDPCDNFVKREITAGTPVHTPTHKWCAAYTEPVNYQYTYQDFEASNFIPNTKGLLGYEYAIKNEELGKRDNVRAKFNYTLPFENNQVWSEFRIPEIPEGRTRSGPFDGDVAVYYDATKPTSITDIQPNMSFTDEGIRGKNGTAALDATFYRKVTITNNINFFDLSGNPQSLTATKATDITDQNTGKIVRFLPGDFQIRDGVPWDGKHQGTQFNSIFSATYVDYINNIGVIQNGDDTKHVSITDNNVNNIIGVSTNRQLIIDQYQVQIPPGRYEPKSLAKIITRGFDTTQIATDFSGVELRYPTNPLLTRLDVVKGDRVVFKNMIGSPLSGGAIDFCANDAYFYDDNCANRTLGAAVYSMEYAQDGDATYEISYMHTPLYNPAETGTQNIAYFQDANTQVFTVPAATGIVVHDLQPAEFWKDTLGFDNNNLIVNLLEDSNGVKYYDGNAAFQKTPRGAVTLDTFTSPIYSRLIDASITPNPTFFEVTDTEGVIGALPLPASQGGYYKVELLGVGLNGNYIDSVTNNASIMGIISTQLDSNNFVTGFGDQSIPYLHRGVPYTISKVRVRISNPDNTPVATLGDETTCFVQINPPLPQQPMPESRRAQQTNMSNYY